MLKGELAKIDTIESRNCGYQAKALATKPGTMYRNDFIASELI